MITQEMKNVLELFSMGRKYYKLMKFTEAKKYFEQALKVNPEDGPSKVFSERCDYYIKNPPPPDWDGVFVMKTK